MNYFVWDIILKRVFIIDNILRLNCVSTWIILKKILDVWFSNKSLFYGICVFIVQPL